VNGWPGLLNNLPKRAGESRTTERVCDDDEPEFLDARHKKDDHWDNFVEAREFAGAERTSILGVYSSDEHALCYHCYQHPSETKLQAQNMLHPYLQAYQAW
jgi:hypothetical protein